MAHQFEDKDLELLNESMMLRKRMMGNIAKRKDEELPVKPSDLMAVTNLLESVDRSIYARAKINIDDSSSKNDEATREVLKELMMNLHANKPTHSGPLTRVIPTYNANQDLQINSGELITRTDNCVPE